MARERAAGVRGTLTRTALVLMGLLIALPLTLIASTMVVLENRLTANAAEATAPAPAAEYARTFSMTVRESGQTIQLWVEDLDGLPNFRQTVEADGETVSDQIYRGDERTFDTLQMDAESSPTWTRVEDVGPEELQLSSLAAGPGAWAFEYGPGDHEVPTDGGALDITVHTVDEDIPAEVFELPQGAEPVPAE